MAEYEHHPLSELQPMMSEGEYRDLVESIRHQGGLDIDEPIILYEGKVLDGRNRLKACRELNIEPVFDTYRGDDPAGFVWLKHGARRNLNVRQRTALCFGLMMQDEGFKKRFEQAKASIKQRRKANLKHVSGQPDAPTDSLKKSDQPSTGSKVTVDKLTNELAAKAGVSKATAKRVIHEVDGDPAKAAAIVAGEKPSKDQPVKEAPVAKRDDVSAHLQRLMMDVPDLAKQLASGEATLGVITSSPKRCAKCGHSDDTCKGRAKPQGSKTAKRKAAHTVDDPGRPPNPGPSGNQCTDFGCIKGGARRLCESGRCGCACHQ